MNIKKDWIFKNYQTRGGQKADILTVQGPDKTHPIVVAVEYPTGYQYESVTNEGLWSTDTTRETNYDLVEVTEITIKQIKIWKGPVQALQDHIGPKMDTQHFKDGVTVSELREVIE